MRDQTCTIWRQAIAFLGRPTACLLVFATLFTAVWLHGRIGDLVELSSDEGFEVLKGSLCAQGARLYSEIWNDQPPLHTWLLATAFRLSSPTMTAARLVAAVFGLLLFVSTFGLARRSGGPLAGWFACLALLGAPEALRLSLAAMLEAPAMGMGLASVWAAFVWKQKGRTRWLFLSGLIMGLALQVKFTAALFIPALAADLASFSWTFAAGASRVPGRFLARTFTVWTAPMMAVFFLVAAAFPGWSLDLLWFSHAAVRLGAERGYSFSMGNLEELLPLLCGSCVLLGLPGLRRKWREFVFYYVLAATVFLVHWFHQPFWYYYVLHFDVALALLSGLGLAELAGPRGPGLPKAGPYTRRKTATAFAFAALLGWISSDSVFSVWNLLDHTKNAAHIEDPGGLPRILASSAGPGRLFSTSPLAGFYARMPMIPDLALLPKKRFWSGKITYATILARVKIAKPSRMVLDPDYRLEPGWPSFLRERYVLRGVVDGLLLYQQTEQPAVEGNR